MENNKTEPNTVDQVQNYKNLLNSERIKDAPDFKLVGYYLSKIRNLEEKNEKGLI